MRKALPQLLAITSLVLVTGAAQAADDTAPYRSQAEQNDLHTEGYLRREGVSIKPQVGLLAFQDPLGNNTTRGAAGLSVDTNIARWVANGPTNLYLGPSGGVIFSHLGSPTSNFFGTTPDAGAGLSDGANMLILPANLKVGYTIGDSFRVAAHGGANVLYRSIASAIPSSSDSSWVVYPNVGGDIEFGLSRNMSLTLRPDVTLTPANDIFSGMLGLGVNLG